jgi:hypothetical protein
MSGDFRKALAFLAGTVLLAAGASAQDAVLRGRVLEKGTKAPLSGAALLLEPYPTPTLTPTGLFSRKPKTVTDPPLSYSAEADPRGFYSFEGAPAGNYRLTVAAPGFATKVLPSLALPAPGPVRLFLEREGFALPEVVVTARRLPKTAVSRQVVTKEELVRVPGTAGDPLRALQSLPGVATAGDVSGQLLVRGGGPDDNAYFLDRIPLAFPFHFGGLISTLNSSIVKNVDFSAGGFGPEFGGVWGGVIDVTQRDVRRDRWGGRADVNLLLSDLLFEGPLSRRAGLSLALRRSYLELMKSFFDDFTAIPAFGDYQAKLDLSASEKTQWNFQAFGSDDRLGLEIKPDSDAALQDPALAGVFEFHNAYHSQGVNLRRVLGERDTLLWTPYHYKFLFHTELGRDLFMRFGLDSFGNRADWLHDFGEDAQLRLGAQYDRQTASVDGFFVRQPSEGNPGFDLTGAERVRSEIQVTYDVLGTYADMRLPLGRRLKLSGGGRFDYFSYNRTSSFSPRFSGACDLDERTVLKASWGIYRQMPQGAQLDPNFGNDELVDGRCLASVLGVERRIRGGLSARLEAFDKELDLIPVPTPVLNYANQGKGFARGVEVFVRQAPTARLFGWLSYTCALNKRHDAPDRPWRYYDYDQRHLLTLVSSYKLTRKWETGLKWRFASGQPDTPIVGALYDAPNSRWLPVYAEVNSARKPAYHRLDLSVSRLSTHDTWQWRWYVEILNVYNSKNVIGYDYNFDYSARKEIKQIPFLPYLGLEVKF